MSFLGALFGWDQVDQEARKADTNRALREAAFRNGWLDWSSLYARSESPYQHQKVWIWKTTWAEMPRLVEPWGLDPAMNSTGLLWKPAKDNEAIVVTTDASLEPPKGGDE